MGVLLHLSDPHFGTEQAPVVAALERLALHQRPDRVLLTGDITQRARTAQFRAARAFVDRLRAPVSAIPGNHDIPLFNVWARVFHPYRGYTRAFGGPLEPEHAADDLLVLGVNTTRPWRHKHGEVSARQVERVAASLAGATARQLRIVMVHQPVAVMRADEQNNLLRGHDAALRSWAASGADVILGGHIHLPYVVAITHLARPLWAVNAGTAVSSRVRRSTPNSVNLLRWSADERRCCVERWDYAEADGEFERQLVTEIEPARGRTDSSPPASARRRGAPDSAV